jgi:hypothetical protein
MDIIDITLKSDSVAAKQQPNVEFILGDKGKALVSLTLIINDNTGIKYRLVYDHPYTGSLTQALSFDKGSYPCTFVIHALTQEAYGRVYDSFLNISGNAVATAKGSVATGEVVAIGHTYFTLNVV